MANTYLTRTQVAGNRQIFTQSIWFKLTNTADQVFISSYNDANNYNCFFLESGNQVLQVLWKKSGSTAALLNTTRKFRDPSAWYHVVLAVDTTQGTAANRIKLYVNGVQETSFSTATYPNQNESIEVNDNNTNQRIGALNTDTFFQGVASYVAQIDGTQELPTVFGETDATTGEWKLKTTITPSVAWGNNGFLVLKDGNSLTDASPNSNNFTVAGGTLTNTEDCPDNNFATLNPLYVVNAAQMPTLTNGNTTGTSTSTGFNAGVASIAPAGSGKYYSEHKLISGTGGWATNTYLGYNQTPSASPTSAPHDTNFFYGVLADGGAREGATNKAGYAGTWTSGDIIQLALDLDNNRLYVGKNGLWADGSGNWDEANINAYINLAASPAVAGENWFMMCGDKNTSTATWGNNFGNGYFGTTAIASEGTNASGIGKFEYDVPTGFTALSTKGLNL
jgi:hypothetical protein